jgi:hypothetical protein
MSVVPDSPMNLPDHRRPPQLGDTGKDSVWKFDIGLLGGDVVFRQDKPAHGLFEPAREMPIDEFQKALADLASRWLEL